MHRPISPSYKTSASLPDSCAFLFLFFFILTLIDTGELKHTLLYNGEPALHIVVLAVMNCPSGPFRSEFLMSNPIFFRCDRCFSSDMEKKTRRESREVVVAGREARRFSDMCSLSWILSLTESSLCRDASVLESLEIQTRLSQPLTSPKASWRSGSTPMSHSSSHHVNKTVNF